MRARQYFFKASRGSHATRCVRRVVGWTRWLWRGVIPPALRDEGSEVARFFLSRDLRAARDGERDLSSIDIVGGRYIEERFLGCVCRRLSQEARQTEEKSRQTPLGMTLLHTRRGHGRKKPAHYARNDALDAVGRKVGLDSIVSAAMQFVGCDTLARDHERVRTWNF